MSEYGVPKAHSGCAAAPLREALIALIVAAGTASSCLTLSSIDHGERRWRRN